MDPVTIEAGAEIVAKGANYLAAKNDRWLLIALSVVVIFSLIYELNQERGENQESQRQLVLYLKDQQAESDEIIERNTAAFESVNETLKLLSRRP